MVQITVEYQGELHTNAKHSPSGTELATDAPKDNHGRGESFSPTDLVATALGSCMLTIMGIVADRNSIDMSGATATVEKDMATDPVRRIGSLTVHIHVPGEVSEKDRKKLERAALTCPVHQSLHPDVKIPLKFSWG